MSGHDEKAIEQEIQDKNLNAPRLKPEDIDEVIVGEQYHVFEGTTLTVCVLTLKNGYTVTGESAAVSPENFDEEIGRKIARDNARNKIWALEGYLLRQQAYEVHNDAAAAAAKKQHDKLTPTQPSDGVDADDNTNYDEDQPNAGN